MIQGFGYINGAYIPIVCLSDHCQDYFCYKKFHLLSVQAVCDYKGGFMDVECTWLGSVHNTKVFENSSIISVKVCVALTYLQYFKL